MTNQVTYKHWPVFLTGLIDGIIVPLSVYCFFGRVLQQQSSALQITLIAGAGMAILLAIGAYFTRKNETDNSQNNKLIEIFANLDISETIRQQMTADTRQENINWLKERGENSDEALTLSPIHYSFIIGGGCITGLLVVLVNGYFTAAHNLWFLVFPLLILMVAGFVKHSLSRQNIIVGTLTTLISGAVAAIANWLVAGLF